MAQRKPTRPATKPPTRQHAQRRTPKRRRQPEPPPPGRKPPGKPGKPGRSIVNQKRTPWGLILTVGLVVLFAAGVIGYALTRHSSKANTSPFLNELATAKQISGITFTPEPERNHVSTTVKYDASPPVGGNHAPVWADCTGTVYPNPIADENAMHSFEHGAVWITYQPGLPQSQITQLAGLVTGQNSTPLPGPDEPHLHPELGLPGLRRLGDGPAGRSVRRHPENNPKTTPEPGASCANPLSSPTRAHLAARPNPDTPPVPNPDGHGTRVGYPKGTNYYFA